MKIYAAGTKAARQSSFTMSVSPASTTKNQEVPADWVDDKNVPLQFNIEFKYGEAEVDDALGRYLIEEGLAKRTRLILPREIPEEDQRDVLIQGQG